MKALVVIDVQKGFVNSHSKPVVPRIKKLLKSGKFKHVVFTRFVNRKRSPYRKIMKWHKLSSAPETDIVDDLLPYANVVFTKSVYSPFSSSDFGNFISKNKITELYLVGIDTECCVLKTAVDAFERGMTPIVLAYYCASHAGKAFHKMGLKAAARYCGEKQVIYRKLA